MIIVSGPTRIRTVNTAVQTQRVPVSTIGPYDILGRPIKPSAVSHDTMPKIATIPSISERFQPESNRHPMRTKHQQYHYAMEP